MGYHDREDLEPSPPPAREPLALAQAVLGIVVRLVGVALLFVGLWAGASVVIEAWRIYEEPARIERFARAIERGSNLDRTLSAITAPEIPRAPEQAPGDESGAAAPAAAAGDAAAPARAGNLHFSYFLAWIVVLLLLTVIGGLAMSAVTTGGRLALYDAQVKKLSRQVVREVRSLDRAA